MISKIKHRNKAFYKLRERKEIELVTGVNLKLISQQYFSFWDTLETRINELWHKDGCQFTMYDEYFDSEHWLNIIIVQSEDKKQSYVQSSSLDFNSCCIIL